MKTGHLKMIVISQNVFYVSILQTVDNVQHSNIGMVEHNAVQVSLALDCISFLILHLHCHLYPH